MAKSAYFYLLCKYFWPFVLLVAHLTDIIRNTCDIFIVYGDCDVG